jgi:hypothetical protein
MVEFASEAAARAVVAQLHEKGIGVRIPDDEQGRANVWTQSMDLEEAVEQEAKSESFRVLMAEIEAMIVRRKRLGLPDLLDLCDLTTTG